MRTSIVVLLALLVLAAGAQHGHGRDHAHGLRHRHALEVEVVTVTDVVYHTVTVVASSTAPPYKPNVCCKPRAALTSHNFPQLKTLSAAQSTSVPDNGSNPYQPIVAVANSASVKNSCSYAVYITSEGHSSCGPGAENKLIAAYSTYTEKLRKCKTGGISLKVSKSQDMGNPMQFEYSVWTDEPTVSYDISYLNCMNGNDLSACAGHDGGIQASAGDDSCPAYHCIANEMCDKQAYVVAEFDYKPGAPVGACAVDKGIAFEFCAGNH